MRLPEPATGAYYVLAVAIILFGAMSIFFQPDYRQSHSYHRLPIGLAPGILYILVGVGIIVYKFPKKAKKIIRR